MTDDEGGPGVRPALAVVLAAVADLALVVFGLGMTSLALDEDVIAVPDLGQLPGVLGIALSVLAFAGVLLAGVRRPRPTYWLAPVTAAAAFLAYLAGVGLGALFVASPGAAAAAVGMLATSWFGAVIAGVALVCGWAGVALVRTRAERPKWPWEDGE